MRPGGGAQRPGRAGPGPGGGDRPARRGRRGRAALARLVEPWGSGFESMRAPVHAQLSPWPWQPGRCGNRLAGAPKEEGRRGTAWSLPLSGLLGRFARTALGNLLTGTLGRGTNANVLEELRVTSLGAEALFSFPAPCPTSARLGQRRMCHQLGARGGIPARLGARVPETKVNGGRGLPRPALPCGRPGGSLSADPGLRLGGVFSWGTIDGNQLAGLALVGASELCCAHIIPNPPTLGKLKEILSSFSGQQM